MTMKKNLSFIFASLVLVLVGCVKNEPVEVLPVDEITVIKAYYSEESKAALNGLAVEWQVGDKIKVNNINSAALKAGDITLPSAKFTFDGVLDAPYYGVYNATAAYEFKTTGANPNCRINLDTPQNYVVGSFDPRVATCWGIGKSKPEIPFEHSMAYIKITPTEGSAPEAKIAYIMLSSRSGEETLAGRFYLYFEDGHMEPVPAHANNRTFVVMQGPAEGVALGNPFIIAVPVQEYTAGLAVKIVSTDGQYMERNLKAITPEVGTIYPIETPYNPKGLIPATATAAEVTSSTACFTWTLVGDVATDVAHAWTVQCSKNEDFSEVVERTIPANSTIWTSNKVTTTPKFVFGGLDQATTYYFRVKSGAEGLWSNVVSATTLEYDKRVVSADVKEGDVVIAEDFAECCEGGEGVYGAAGYGSIDQAFKSRTDAKTVNTEALFANYPSLANWGFARLTTSANFYVQQGHVKLGTSSAQSYLVTPELSVLPADKLATVKVYVTLAAFVDDATRVKKAVVAAQSGSMAASHLFTISGGALTNKVEFNLASSNTSWNTYEVTLNNVKRTDRIIIGSPEDKGNYRLNVNDVKVEIVSIENMKVTDIQLVQADRTNATIKWNHIGTGKAENATYVVEVYKDATCENAVYSNVVTYDAPLSRYSPYGTSKFIGQKNGSALYPSDFRVCCGLLEPSTTYWFRVKPLPEDIVCDATTTHTSSGSTTFTNSAKGADWSDAFQFTTAAPHITVENEVIYTGFDAVTIGPNFETMAAGVSPQLSSKDANVAEKQAFYNAYKNGTYNYGWFTWTLDRRNQGGYKIGDWWFCDKNDVVYLDGVNTYFTLNGEKRYNRLGKYGDIENWYITSQCYPSMGHICMKDTGNYVGTPALTTNLPEEGNAVCTVNVKAAKIANDGNTDDVTIKVYKYSRAANALNTSAIETLTIAGDSCYSSWSATNTYTCDFTPITLSCEVELAKGDALVFSSSAPVIIDEIQIVKK